MYRSDVVIFLTYLAHADFVRLPIRKIEVFAFPGCGTVNGMALLGFAFPSPPLSSLTLLYNPRPRLHLTHRAHPMGIGMQRCESGQLAYSGV